MSFSDYMENELLDHILSAQSYSPPATVDVALCTAAVVDSDDGTSITEPVGNGYLRKNVNNNATEWPNASGGSKQNGQEVAFDQATGSWSTITHYAILEGGTDNIMVHGALNSARAIGLGDTARFQPSTLTINLD